MPQTKADSALARLQYLVQDEYVQEQLREAAGELRGAYSRVAAKRSKAADDKKLYSNVRRAAASVRNATAALRKQEPPPKRRGRKLLVLALTGAGAALLAKWARSQRGRGTAEANAATMTPLGHPDGVSEPLSGVPT
jgi:ferric-dicitrate binding protein FerR (iron transport regulator)